MSVVCVDGARCHVQFACAGLMQVQYYEHNQMITLPMQWLV